tara:strand:+ start:477 stop:635 length:159 start_codon:yes stop_codon:yes gene_type:complete
MLSDVETEQQEQRRIEDDIVDNWNYEEAEDMMDTEFFELEEQENGTATKNNI